MLPYLFISYSHKDQTELESVKKVLDSQNIRYWYDDGLHSGDDWNLEIAAHLQDAAACLLLLSIHAARSEYVKNELNFAQSHRIPIHILLLHEFELPIDIEMMTGRIQMTRMTGDYYKTLLKSLPGEVFANENRDFPDGLRQEHPLFAYGKLRSDRQGTKLYDGMHKRLQYLCTIAEETVRKEQLEETKELAISVSSIRNPVFPLLYDVVFDGQKMVTYQEFCGGIFLDDYLKEKVPAQETIIRWMKAVVEGIGFLYQRRFAFRDFAGGSFVVDEKNNLRILRLQNPYYGVCRFGEETRQYYFEKSLQEIAVLLAELCSGKEPVLPIRMVENENYEKKFLTKINVIIQKCTKENGRTAYHSFEELMEDLEQKKNGIQDRIFLQKRKKKLKDYDAARESAKAVYSSKRPEEMKNSKKLSSVEKTFGFDETIVVAEPVSEEEHKIRVFICPTGQEYNFDKDEITVGRDTACDIICTQPAVSRKHVKIRYWDANTYIVTDLHSKNRTFLVDTDMLRMEGGKDIEVQKGSTIQVGGVEMKLL